jgi:hypothetical protein
VRTLRAVPAALTKGFSDWKTQLVLLWVSLLCAGIAVFPDLGAIFRFYGHAPLARGKPLLSAELLFGLQRAFPPGGGPLGGLTVAVLVGALLTLFVTGGVVWRAWTVDTFRFSEFFAESSRMFGRVLRTLLWSLPLLALCAGAVAGVAALLHVLHHDSVFSAHTIFWVTDRPITGWALAHLVLLGVLWALWRMTLDAARVISHVEDLRQTRKAVWRGFRLVIGAPGAWMAYAFLGVVEFCAVLLMMRLHASLPEGNAPLAWLALLVAQLVVLVRAGFQVSTTAFAADLVRRARSAAAPAAVTAAAGIWPGGLATPPVAAAATEAPASADPSSAESEPFELLSRPPPRTGSTSEMPLVDADLVEEEPSGGGPGKV